MFEDATFNSNRIHPAQTATWMLVAFAVNLTLLSSLVVLPLIYPQGLPTLMLRRTLYAPPPAFASRPQAHSAQNAATPVPRNLFSAPPVIPTQIYRQKDDQLPPGDISVIPMGSPFDTVPGGTRTVTTLFRPIPQTVVHQAAPSKVALSQGVIEGLLIYRTTPAYPPIARAAGVSGTIILAATISKTGVIENLRVLSGQPMLRQTALDAVKNWRYRPYLLNNQLVEVETTINIVFSLGNR